MPQGPLDAGPTVGGRTGCPCSPPEAAGRASRVGRWALRPTRPFPQPVSRYRDPDTPQKSRVPSLPPRRPGCFSHRGSNHIFRGMPPASGEVRNSVLRLVSVFQSGGLAAIASRQHSVRPSDWMRRIDGSVTRLSDERLRPFAAALAGTHRHHGADGLPPWSKEQGQVLLVEHLLEDQGTGRVSDRRADHEPWPLHLRQCASPRRCGAASRLLVLGKASYADGRSLSRQPRTLLGRMSVDQEARCAGVINVGRLVQGQLTGAPNDVLHSSTGRPILPHTSTNASFSACVGGTQ